jgi:hypothetical protein
MLIIILLIKNKYLFYKITFVELTSSGSVVRSANSLRDKESNNVPGFKMIRHTVPVNCQWIGYVIFFRVPNRAKEKHWPLNCETAIWLSVQRYVVGLFLDPERDAIGLIEIENPMLDDFPDLRFCGRPAPLGLRPSRKKMTFSPLEQWGPSATEISQILSIQKLICRFIWIHRNGFFVGIFGSVITPASSKFRCYAPPLGIFRVVGGFLQFTGRVPAIAIVCCRSVSRLIG